MVRRLQLIHDELRGLDRNLRSYWEADTPPPIDSRGVARALKARCPDRAKFFSVPGNRSLENLRWVLAEGWSRIFISP
jgi:hypothetical protein